MGGDKTPPPSQNTQIRTVFKVVLAGRAAKALGKIGRRGDECCMGVWGMGKERG